MTIKEKPILFSAPMVLAILDGRKTQTRRVLKPVADIPQAVAWHEQTNVGVSYARPGYWSADIGGGNYTGMAKNPYGQPGGRLWVRENFTVVPASAYRMSEGVQQTINPNDPYEAAIYAAGWDRSIPRWKPSIHMPRWACRIELEITAVRVERLQDISEDDAISEGAAAAAIPESHQYESPFTSHRRGFHNLWDSLNAKRAPWESNPWLWVVEFKRVKP